MNQPGMIEMSDIAFAVALAYCAAHSAQHAPAPALRLDTAVPQAVAGACEPRQRDGGYLERLGEVLEASEGMASPGDCPDPGSAVTSAPGPE